MQFIDLAAQQKRIKKKIDKRIQDVLKHGQYILGPEIKELEDKLAAYVGVKHAIACSSGTDALLAALMAKNVLPGDTIFTTPFTFIATAETIGLLRASPCFIDIDKKTFNMDIEKLEHSVKVFHKYTPHSMKGIIAVDLFGAPADYDAINAIAKKYNLFVIEDAAQSFGAEYNGKKACSLGDIGATSFFPAKPLGAYGDGGMIFTDDDELAIKLRSITVHGMGENRYDHDRIGLNARLDTMQAAILLAKFEIFPEEIELRQEVAKRYNNLLEDVVEIPVVNDNVKSVWAQYSVLAKDFDQRNEFFEKLHNAKIPSAVYYSKPIHLQDAFPNLGYTLGDKPVTEEISQRIFSLPMHPYLKEEDQKRIADVLKA